MLSSMDPSRHACTLVVNGASSSPWRLWTIVMCLGMLLSFISLQLCRKCQEGESVASIPPQVTHQGVMARAQFVDRNGVLLAGNLKTFSVYANPRLIQRPSVALRKLRRVFPELDAHILKKRLCSNKHFIWITRHVTPLAKERLLKEGIPGVSLIEDRKRIYPQKNLFSHVLGFTDLNNSGIEGLEKVLEPRMYKRKLVKLSLDSRIQYAVHACLADAIENAQAEGGGAIVANLKTGEVLAIVSQPDFDPNQLRVWPKEHLFNRNLVGVYEFGSVLKIHNVAMALEKKVADVQTMFDASEPLRLGRFHVTDFRGKNKPLTLAEAFLCSSNIVNAKIALAAGMPSQKAFFDQVGLLKRVSLGSLQTSAPILPRRWGQSTVATASYGYSLSLTPLHMVQSVARIVTGRRVTLSLSKQSTPPVFPRFLSEKTVNTVTHLLKRTVLEGQARKAAISGYSLGAKTGTANIIDATGRYQKKKNLVCCVAVFPAVNPQYIVFNYMEHPKPGPATCGFATAGWFAAPLAGRIVKRVSPMLGLTPTAPL